MKVLITGATGLIGKELVSLLQCKDIAVNYLTTSQDKINDRPDYKGYLWNPDKGLIDTACLKGVEAIYHLAGASVSKRWTNSYKKEILDSRIKSTKLLYNTLANNTHTVKHFISASAIGIYPDSLTKVYSEDDTAVDNSFLGEVVQQWEAAVDAIKKLDIKVLKLRTGIVLSGNGGALAEMEKPVKLGVGSGFGSGRQMQSWIHVQDLAGIYYHILDNNLEGVYNGVAPHPVSNNKLMHSIAEVLDKPYFMPNIPEFAMKLVLGEMHIILFTSQNVSARKIVNAGYQFKFLSLKDALSDALK